MGTEVDLKGNGKTGWYFRQRVLMKLVGRIAEVEKRWWNCNCPNCSCTSTSSFHLLKMLKLSFFSIIKFKSVFLFVQLYIRQTVTLLFQRKWRKSMTVQIKKRYSPCVGRYRIKDKGPATAEKIKVLSRMHS